MTSVFADTSFYVARLNSADACRQQALAWGELPLRMISTDFVLLELGNFVCRGPERQRFAALVASLRADPYTKIIPLSTALLDAGLDLYNRRPDKTWSLTDCISFVVMKQEGLTEALTAASHFQQAGFKALLRHAPPARA